MDLSRAIGLDTETELIKPGRQFPPLVCLSFKHAGDYGVIHKNDPACLKLIEWMLAECDPIWGLNVAYEWGVILAQWPDLAESIFAAYADSRIIDVGLQQRLVDISNGSMRFREGRGGYSLAGLEKRLLKRDRSAEKSGPDVWRLRYAELMDVPCEDWPPEAYMYAYEDAEGAFDIGHIQLQRWLPLLADAPRQSRAAFALLLMEAWGIHTDGARVRLLEREAKRIYEDVKGQLEGLKLVRADGSKDTKAARRHMVDICRQQGLERPKLTKTGYEKYEERVELSGERKSPLDMFEDVELEKYVSIDQEACLDSADTTMMTYGRYIQLQAMAKTHVPDLLNGVFTPIQARYNVLVDSGRTSCSKGKPKKGQEHLRTRHGFQMQNPKRAEDHDKLKKFGLEPLPVDVRECFKARPRKLLADCDFSGLELCTVSQVCMEVLGYSTMGDAINAGKDVHLDMAAAILNISYEEAQHRKHEKEVKHARQLSKIANFGYPGGLGAGGFAAFARGYGVKLSSDDGDLLKKTWQEKWPEFREYFRWVREQLELDQSAELLEALKDLDLDEEKIEKLTIKIPTGTFTQLYVGRYRGRCRFTQGSNTMFQGLGADGAKSALWEVSRRCYDPSLCSVLYGVRPAIFVHDQIVSEVDEDLAHEQAFEQARVMVEACNKFLPDVPTKVEPALGTHWSKELEGVFDKNGRLVPYDLAKAGKWRVFYADEQPVRWAA